MCISPSAYEAAGYFEGILLSKKLKSYKMSGKNL